MLPRQSCQLGRACVEFFTQVLLWFGMELPRKGSAKGGGIRDARVKARPVNWLTPEAQDPETQLQFAHSVAEILVPPSMGPSLKFKRSRINVVQHHSGRCLPPFHPESTRLPLRFLVRVSAP